MIVSKLLYGWFESAQLRNMKKRKYYRLAERLFPEEKDRKLLVILAEGLRKNEGKEPSKEEMGF